MITVLSEEENQGPHLGLEENERYDRKYPKPQSNLSRGGGNLEITRTTKDDNKTYGEFVLPIPSGWKHEKCSVEEGRKLLSGIPISDNSVFPELLGIQHTFLRSPENHRAFPKKRNRKGWPKPGPGPRKKTKRSFGNEEVDVIFMLAVIHATAEALQFEQAHILNQFDRSSGLSCFEWRIDTLSKLEGDLDVPKTVKKHIWSLSTLLGVFSFLFKLRSPDHAIELHLLQEGANMAWSCSFCIRTELQSNPSCAHIFTMMKCIQRIAHSINMGEQELLESFKRTAAFYQRKDQEIIMFQGDGKKAQFAVLRDCRESSAVPLQTSERVIVLKQLMKSNDWKCIAKSCSGISTTCQHVQTLRHIRKTRLAACNLSLFPEQPSQDRLFSSTTASEVIAPGHPRPMIPSVRAFKVDEEVNLRSLSDTSKTLPAAIKCHCGCDITDTNSSEVIEAELRIESHRCHVTYKQCIWTCKNGHLVTPEEDQTTRDGILWISKHTAYTEVFLFDILMQMTFSGSTISGQTEVRNQLSFLRQQYGSKLAPPRSNPCVRKALTVYAMSVIQNMPAWVYRCSNCSTYTEGGIYHDKMSFDGQQIGFKIRDDVHNDFYRCKETEWRRPVERCDKAWQCVHVIESHSLRNIIVEALRVREVPMRCNSVLALCRAMMKISLNTKEAIRAAVAAVKLFDPLWKFRPHFPPSLINDSTLETYLLSNNIEQETHPFQFIFLNMSTLIEFTTAKKISNIFCDLIDCTKAAAILVVLLTNIRDDLKAHIPQRDMTCLMMFAPMARNRLDSWLTLLADSSYWNRRQRNNNSENPSSDDARGGIAEHAGLLKHPYRVPLSWEPLTVQQSSQHLTHEKLRCMLPTVRAVDSFGCPIQGATRILLLLLAIFKEPVSVWLRQGSFQIIDSALETIRQAFFACGGETNSSNYLPYLMQMQGCTLLYEGVMAMLGATSNGGKIMFNSIYGFLICIKTKYDIYSEAMETYSTKKRTMISPKVFDTTIASAARSNIANDTSNHDEREYEQNDSVALHFTAISSTLPKDLRRTGVWAPDFPVRRPTATPAGIEKAENIEVSCSKNFAVHQAFSPGLFSAHCLCKHSKTIAVTFLKKAEGCRMPLNFIIERCNMLPSYVVYDFACGTQKSALGLSKEVTRKTRFVIDPFHFPGHKSRSLAMHQSNFSELEGCNTESQEQRNKSIKLMQNTLRACKDTNFMYLIVLANGYINLKAMFLDHYDRAPNSQELRGWIAWVRDNLF